MAKLPKDIVDLIDKNQLQIDENFKRNLKNQLIKEGPIVAKSKKSNSKFNFSGAGWQNFFKKLNTASGLAVIALLVVVGTASAVISSKNTRLNSERETEIPANLDGVLPIDNIKAQALSDVPDGQVTGVELENEDGRLVYKVRFADGSFRLYDAKTGELITNKIDGVEQDESVPAGFVSGVDLATARSIAQAERPGKTINKIELETENGVVVYSVRFADGGRVDVNANDGSVIRVRNTSTSTSSNSDNNDDQGEDDDHSGSSGSGSDDGSNHDSNEDKSGSSSGSGSSGSGSSGSGHDESDDD